MTGEISFNLVNEEWLPCREKDGQDVVNLSLRDALVRAHEVAVLVDSSPLNTAALHRLLLAVLHRVFGPSSEEQWLDMWQRGAFDGNALDRYLDSWQHRFDLFDAQHPFFQTTAIEEKYAGPVSKLLLERASGNNATLFDHSLDATCEPVDASGAARAVVTYQNFATPGLVSYQTGETQHRSAKAGPLAKGAMALARGETLFETLLLNLVEYAPARGRPFPVRGDRPAWESDTAVVAEDRAPLGYLDYLTWQSRRIRLIPEHLNGGPIQVRRVVLMKGAQLPAGLYVADYEQLLAFKTRLKPAAGQEPFLTVGFSEDRAFWRDSHALLDTFGAGLSRTDRDGPPRTIRWLARVQKDPSASSLHDRHIPLDLLGIAGDRAKLLFWRHERLPVRAEYLRKPELVEVLSSALNHAEDGARALRSGVSRLASLTLSPEQAEGGRTPDSKLVQAVAAHLDAGRTYWSGLEPHFKKLLVEIPDDVTQVGSQTLYGEQVLADWRKRVRHRARDSFAVAVRGLDANGRALKAATRAEGLLNALLLKSLGAE